MRTRPPLLALALVLLGVATASSPGCAHEDTVAPGLADVFFEGSASDEAWIALDEAPLTDDPGAAGWTFTPTRWARAGAAPTFTWSSSLAGGRHRRSTPVEPRSDDEPAKARLARGLSELLHPVAHAHLPPVTGTVYRLVFTIPGEAAPLRVFTTDRSYTPGGTAFAALNRATGPISLAFVHAYLADNRVMEGPFRLPPILLTPE